MQTVSPTDNGERIKMNLLDLIGTFLEPPPTSRYKVGKVLGEGGHGKVWLATDRKSGDQVVLKRVSPSIDPGQRDRLEARMLREADPGFHDTYVITAIDHGHDSEGLYVVFPLAPGKDLVAHAEDGWLAADEEATLIVTKVAKGLTAIHDAGLQHGDIKPNNIVYEPSSRSVHIIDLGLVSDPHASPRLTRPDQPLGTLAFIAPECITSPCQRDPRSDLHALGCVLYWLYSGESPYEAASEPEAIHRVTHEEPVPLEHVNPTTPSVMAALSRGLLAKHPEDRWPQTAREVVDVLEGRRPIDPDPSVASHATVPRCLACGSPCPDPLRCQVCGRDILDGLSLHCTFRDGRTRDYRVPIGRYEIGRNELARSNHCLSRRQAEVKVTGLGLYLRNLATTNPTVVDGVTAAGDRMISVCSRLQFADISAQLRSLNG